MKMANALVYRHSIAYEKGAVRLMTAPLNVLLKQI